MLPYTSDDISRLTLAAVCVWSAIAAGWWARHAHVTFLLHCLWIVVWSLVAAGGMLSLAGEAPFNQGALFVEALNTSFACLILGWVFLLRRKVPL